MSQLRPANITADRQERILKIEWVDGHHSVYPFTGLRAVCPCVECKGGHANMGAPADPTVVRDAPNNPDLSIEQITASGNYAINIVWSDGHYTGIFTWKLLRQACPCEICLAD